MSRHSLSTKGLSLSQAQSVSNQCHQRALEIESKLSNINNFSKTIIIEGKPHDILKSRKIPSNIVELLEEKGKLHSCQAFLMENIKAKNDMLTKIKTAQAKTNVITLPNEPEVILPDILPTVSEEWGWDQLSPSEYNEYLEVESYAAHIGQFIHKGSILSTLRAELPNTPDIEWMVINDGVKTPVIINVHHTSEELLSVHEKLSTLHRHSEQRVNYYKAKVKNLVTEENARIAKLNNEEQIRVEVLNTENQTKYQKELDMALSKIKMIKTQFEIFRQQEIQRISSLRINVDPRFQEIINEFIVPEN